LKTLTTRKEEGRRRRAKIVSHFLLNSEGGGGSKGSPGLQLQTSKSDLTSDVVTTSPPRRPLTSGGVRLLGRALPWKKRGVDQVRRTRTLFQREDGPGFGQILGQVRGKGNDWLTAPLAHQNKNIVRSRSPEKERKKGERKNKMNVTQRNSECYKEYGTQSLGGRT